MILLDTDPDRLRPAEKFGLDVLIDCSRLLVAEHADCDLVRLTVVDRPSSASSTADLAAARALERAAGEVRVTTAALGAVAEVAGGATEQRSSAADRQGRVKPEENPLITAGRAREPLVSILSMELRRAATAVAERRPIRCLAPWPQGYRWAALVTHELDAEDRWVLTSLLRMIELSRRRAWHKTVRVARAAWRSIGRDPLSRGVRAILQLEAHYGVAATWFVTRPEADSDATPTSRILDALFWAGHEIGLRANPRTVKGAEQLASQRSWLSRMTRRPVNGVRQHLEAGSGPMQHALATAGFDYDATWGFADRNGFRLGVADVVPAWDANRESTMPLELVPLAWIDRAVSRSSGMEDAQRWIEDGVELARVAKSVEGVWAGLWHPHLTEPLGFPGAEPAFVDLLQALANGRPYFAPASKIVEWRRFRRSVRVSRITADGRVLLTGIPGHRTVTLEDETGEATQVQLHADRSSGAA